MKINRRIKIWGLILALLLSAECAKLPVDTVQAAGQVMTLSQAQNLALVKNKNYRKIKSKISMEQVKYAAAVKSIQLKKKNMATFRWTPLLSFKFPQQPALADEYEWQYKPLQIQTRITALTHQLADTRYETVEKVSGQYVTVYILQEKISFIEERIGGLKKNLAANEVRVKTGEGKQADVDKMKSSLKKLEKDLSRYMRNFERAKGKLADTTGTKLPSGYLFTNPLVEADLSRKMLQGIISHTLEEDQAFYEIRLNTQLAYIGLTLNESLMRSQYGGKINSLQAYVNQAKSGQELDSDAFKSTYDQFLREIDEPWNGKKRILFIRIPKEWFKGEIDGVRYIQDEPYALYTAALDYQDAKQERDSMEKELKESVTDSFEALVTARNAYQSMTESVEELEQSLKKSMRLNQIGELEYEELDNERESYEDLQLECMDALASYSELLYSFDRLTCGGITSYLLGENLDQESVSGGTSYLEEELAEGAFYYIQSKVEDNVFVFGISVPEDFSVSVTAYELWVDDTQVGKRTDPDQQIRHLTLALENPQHVRVFLFDGDKKIDEVEIDARVTRGELPVKGGYKVIEKNSRKKVASFSYTVNERLRTSEISFEPKAGEEIAYYQITDENGKELYQKKLVSIDESFRYLSVMTENLSQLKVLFYDSRENLLYEGKLDELTQSVIAVGEQE